MKIILGLWVFVLQATTEIDIGVWVFRLVKETQALVF